MNLKQSSSSWKLFIGILIPLILYSSVRGQSADFTVPDQICLTETLPIEDLTNLLTDYRWDFCHEDLLNIDQVGDISTITGASSVQSFRLVYDSGLWYGFAGSRLTDEIFRIEYGTSLLEETPNIVSIGDLGESSLRPNAIDFAKESDIWYGFFANQNGDIIKVTFDDGLGAATFSTDNLGDLSSWLFIYDLDLEYDDDNSRWIMSVADANGDKISMVDLGSSLATATGNTIVDIGTLEADITNTRGIDLIKTNSGWYELIADVGSDKIILASFGNNLLAEPSYSTLLNVTNPTKVRVYKEGLVYVAYALTSSGLHRLNFGNDLTILNSDESLGTFSNTFSANNIALDFAKFTPTWVGFSVNNVNNNLSRITFSSDCSSTMTLDDSSEGSPAIQYTADGDYIVELTGYDQYGNSFVHEDTITVLNQTAPSISFTSDNVCVNSLVTFSPSNTGLTTYEWDFNGNDIIDVTDMTGADQSFDYSGLGTGTYTVRLDVSDGTCNNFFEQEITIYDPPPSPSYTYSSAQTCINADFTFTNTTSDGAYTGPLAYLWEFIDEPSGMVVATANTKDAVYAFETEGQKTVRLTSSIPGCIEITEQTLMITPGPTANFFAASVCQNEAMQFTNTSTDAISYSWDFGDGFMSTATNPSHIFTGAGNFFVALTATDAEGCDDTEVIEVAVSDSPQINFDFDIPCTSTNGTQFFDLTTVDNADLVSWTWYLDDVEVSTEQSPQIVFESTGVKNIRLDVTSSNGCESSYSEDIEVLESPIPDFAITLGCQGEASSFIDNTSSTGNPIVSWLWTVDGVNYGTQDIEHTFLDAGNYDVTLEVTGQNFCAETITKSIEIIELPTVDFSIEGECDNQLIQASDQSTSSADPVVARRWMLDGENVGNGSQVILADLSDNTYDLTLELETQSGCIISASQSLVINNAPESSFTSSRTFGIPGDQLTFTNTSTGGVSYQWLLNGEPISTNPNSELITFSEAGGYDVSLVTQNSLSCNDTVSQQILIAIPEVDLAIGSFELVSENNIGRIFLEVQNLSNLPVEIIDAQIVLENTFAITEQIVGFIDVGATSLVSLNVGIPLTVSEPAYFCVKLSSQYVDYQDLEPVNNEKCLTIDPVIKVEDPFPNPVTNQFRLKLIVNESGTANLSLINSAGKVQIRKVENVSEGLNNFFIDMSLLDPGIYYVLVDIQGTIHRKKVIKL
ncbi:PKD domain-containing protein [Ekhidna sp. To15]|uniref:PKD domain-containing protein n=1 Tax=Ekhidna sp. To15 TaxID=3395267 RepID=UPI003F523104